MKTYEAPGGERIGETARKMIALMRKEGDSVETDFNGVSLTASMGDDSDSIIDAYEREIGTRERRKREAAERRERERLERAEVLELLYHAAREARPHVYNIGHPAVLRFFAVLAEAEGVPGRPQPKYREAIRQANYLMGQDRRFWSVELFEKWLRHPAVVEAIK